MLDIIFELIIGLCKIKSAQIKILELIKVDLKSEKFFLNIVNCRCRLVPGDVCMSKVGLGLNKI